MNDNYLWDRSGPPDLEVARLEKLLSPLGHRPRRKRWIWIAVAAAAMLLAGLVAPRLMRGEATEWHMAGRQLHSGDRVGTGLLESEKTGQVQVEAGSDLRLRDGRMELRKGTMHALIWAAPGEFVVDTPSARTIDLGCSYTLRVGEDGTGVVTVEAGLVAFEWGGRKSLVPAGAMCRTRPKRGPGTPYFTDAPERLKAGVERFDSGDMRGLADVLATARSEDAMTLEHLLQRTTGDAHRQVAAALANRERLQN